MFVHVYAVVMEKGVSGSQWLHSVCGTVTDICCLVVNFHANAIDGRAQLELVDTLDCIGIVGILY